MTLLDRLRGGLIVSVQAPRDSALYDAGAISTIAAAACEAGAVAVRVESEAHVRAVRALIEAPVIGIVKRRHEGFEPYITPTLEDVKRIAEAGAHVVAFDATDRRRPDDSTVAQLVAAICENGAAAMADCAVAQDGLSAVAAGAAIVATTLFGYTEQTRGARLPALDLVRELATIGAFVVCEGGIETPESGRAAIDAGADAIVVGTAITGIARRTQAFAEALR